MTAVTQAGTVGTGSTSGYPHPMSSASKVAHGKAKKKCCRSKTRCLTCPVVIMRMKKLEQAGVTGKDLKKGLKKARAA